MMPADASFTTNKTTLVQVIPVLYREEVECGNRVGQGSFCHVSAVKQVVLILIEKQQVVLDDTQQQQQARRRLAKRFENAPKPTRSLDIYGLRLNQPIDPADGQAPRLALKRLREGLAPAKMKLARSDLKRELEILLAIHEDSTSTTGSTTSHPNIIELHAIGIDDKKEEEGEDQETADLTKLQPSFLVLSRVRCTLTNVLVSWRNRRGLGVWEALSLDVQETRNLWVERVMVLSRLASVIAFLHARRILYRDMKPDNVGFDLQNVPKLFDFGLAKRIPQKDDVDDGLYKLTGDTGTIRYMSPEVALSQPYGWTADVYSLSILMHEVLSLKIPFAGLPPSTFTQAVAVDGKRPPLEDYSAWPLRLRELLEQMWNADPTSRPMSETVQTSLEGLLRGSDEELFPANMVVASTSKTSWLGNFGI
jgi:serine/threonine protein kinase